MGTNSSPLTHRSTCSLLTPSVSANASVPPNTRAAALRVLERAVAGMRLQAEMGL